MFLDTLALYKSDYYHYDYDYDYDDDYYYYAIQPVLFSLTKTKMVNNEKIMNSLTKTKTKTKKWWKLKQK